MKIARRLARRLARIRVSNLEVKYGFDALRLAYPGWNDKYLRDLFAESSSFEYEYEPYTQFRHKAQQGRFITISEHGFRPICPGQPWPPSSNLPTIFIFGGSNLLGAAVPNGQTVPAFIHKHLKKGINCQVYNFSRSYYSSTQERSLFQKLLQNYAPPQLAIFFDGLNDFAFYNDIPKWASQIHAAFTKICLRRFSRTVRLLRQTLNVPRRFRYRNTGQKTSHVGEDAALIATRALGNWE